MYLPGKKRITIAIIIVLVYLIVILIYYPSISGTYSDITKTQQPYTFQVPISFDVTGGNGNMVIGNQSDVEIGLTITYPNGTLVANEVVNVTSIIVLKGVGIKTVAQIEFTFQDWLEYPPNTEEVSGIPIAGVFSFTNTMNQFYITNTTPPTNLRVIS